MTNEPVAVETALIGLYNYTRKANIPLDDHDLCRAYVDVLAQALNMKLQWSVPEQPSQEAKPTETIVAKARKKN